MSKLDEAIDAAEKIRAVLVELTPRTAFTVMSSVLAGGMLHMTPEDQVDSLVYLNREILRSVATMLEHDGETEH